MLLSNGWRAISSCTAVCSSQEPGGPFFARSAFLSQVTGGAMVCSTEVDVFGEDPGGSQIEILNDDDVELRT